MVVVSRDTLQDDIEFTLFYFGQVEVFSRFARVHLSSPL